ncbi:sigma-54-dependent Fis family transcriptional regulator [Rhodobacteraceae bacterium RKSG542]|uniref:sigma-54-dependent transcriptional regulator n=1 Tax=Pseudovibrio flavus TaxID=2529854 RepID=UPI0012BCBAB2|nr:sigma-54 dependent transcriptional regulator [Pseudovibrio flavus]MTI18894.1 sigma-54-dependent Fis family transcriptional regulator [Pseudovibrio flavus]
MAEQQARVLVVEDTYALLETYKAYLRPEPMDVIGFETGVQALESIQLNEPSVIVLDINLPDMNGLDILKAVKSAKLKTEVVVITGQASVNLAVEAMRAGAFDFLMKPFSADRLRETVRAATERSRIAVAVDESESTQGRTERFAGIIGHSEPMQRVFQILKNAAPSSASIFISGESGTGKEVCANAVHELSKRRDKPFVTINCAAIPKDLLESEIFGHIKGAFTGATADRQGAALSADGGTLFLDEICEMDLLLQSKLLRFLQEKQVQRVGEDRLRPADVRIVCATNRDPLIEIAEGRFREDLYYRLHVVPVFLPPLRERAGDVLLLANYFLTEYAREEGKGFKNFSEHAEETLTSYPWPGNIRELQNAIRNAVVLNDGDTLEKDMLPHELVSGGSRSSAATNGGMERRDTSEALVPPPTGKLGRAAEALSEAVAVPSRSGEMPPVSRPVQQDDRAGQFPFQRSYSAPVEIMPLETVIRLTIEDAIERCGGSIPKAAAALEVSPSTIYRRLQAWEEEDQRKSEEHQTRALNS